MGRGVGSSFARIEKLNVVFGFTHFSSSVPSRWRLKCYIKMLHFILSLAQYKIILGCNQWPNYLERSICMDALFIIYAPVMNYMIFLSFIYPSVCIDLETEQGTFPLK